MGRKISCSLVNSSFMRRMRLFLGAPATLNQTERHEGKDAISANTNHPGAGARHVWKPMRRSGVKEEERDVPGLWLVMVRTE